MKPFLISNADLSATDELKDTGSQRLKMIFSINGVKNKTNIDIQKPIPIYPMHNTSTHMTKTTTLPKTGIDENQSQPNILGFTNMFQRIQSGSTCSVCDK
jgi:hypothetical protein